MAGDGSGASSADALRDGAPPENGAPGAEPGAQKKSYVTILRQEIEEGVEQLERPTRGLLLSGLSAGLDLGFSVLAIGAVETLAGPDIPELMRRLLTANAYAIGFILVIFGRSELFTEHTTLAVLPLLDGRTSARGLGRVWGLVYVSNLVGVTAFAAALAAVGPPLGTVAPHALDPTAAHLLDQPWWVILASAVLAGWLMGLVSWLVTAGRDTTSQILFVWLVTGLIGLAGLHHCILGSGEVLAAAFTGAPVSAGDFTRFLALATAGNAVGGFVFVALLKYGYATVVRPGLRDPRGWGPGHGDA